MKSPLAILTGLICSVFIIVLSVTVSAADNASSFQPQWHAADADLVWQVQVVYASPGNQNTWSSPVLWEYRISKSENSGAEDRFIHINARCLDMMAAHARFVYRKNDVTLVSAEISNIVRGDEKIKTLTFDGGVPIASRQSPIPFDMPVFPVFPGVTGDFKVVSLIDGFLKKESVIEQAVTVVSGGAPPFPEWTAGKQLFKIECRDKNDGKRLFVQYWDADYPWPVYGENKNMKYWMDVK